MDAKQGTSTGTSAFDRARTLRALADPRATASDFVRPGHIFPLRAVPGGVLRRAGHSEAAPDLCELAGLQPVGGLCEILSETGRMARLPQLIRFATRHRLGILTIRDLIAWRRRREVLVERVVSVPLPTPEGEFTLHLYQCKLEGDNHLALVMGKVGDGKPVLVRVHSQCLTGDVLGSQRCDCGEQLHAALRAIARKGRGVLLYLRQEGRGIGLAAKLKAYALQDRGLDTVEANERLGYPADLRDYGIGAQILADLGVREIELLTNNPRKLVGLEAHGLRIVRRLPIRIAATRHNRRYLATKRDKLGHLLDLKLGDLMAESGDPGARLRKPTTRAATASAWWPRASAGLCAPPGGCGAPGAARPRRCRIGPRVVWVPGSFELPLACAYAAHAALRGRAGLRRPDRGETEHFRLVAEAPPTPSSAWRSIPVCRCWMGSCRP